MFRLVFDGELGGFDAIPVHRRPATGVVVELVEVFVVVVVRVVKGAILFRRIVAGRHLDIVGQTVKYFFDLFNIFSVRQFDVVENRIVVNRIRLVLEVELVEHPLDGVALGRNLPFTFESVLALFHVVMGALDKARIFVRRPDFHSAIFGRTQLVHPCQFWRVSGVDKT